MAKKKKLTSPSHLQRNPHGYYFRYSIPPDVRPAVGRTELKCSLRTGKLSEAKTRSGILSSLTHLAVSNIRSGGRMSELSPAEIQNLVKRRFAQALEEDEANRTNRKPLGEEEWMDEWNLNEIFLSETKEQLAKSDYHDVSGAVEWLLADNGLDVNKESESFKRLCREMLKVEIKILEIAKHRDLGDYEYEETVFQQPPIFSPEVDNRPTETITEEIKHYVSESEANWTPKTKAEIVDGSLALLVETVGDVPLQSVDRRKMNGFHPYFSLGIVRVRHCGRPPDTQSGNHRHGSRRGSSVSVKDGKATETLSKVRRRSN